MWLNYTSATLMRHVRLERLKWRNACHLGLGQISVVVFVPLCRDSFLIQLGPHACWAQSLLFECDDQPGDPVCSPVMDRGWSGSCPHEHDRCLKQGCFHLYWVIIIEFPSSHTLSTGQSSKWRYDPTHMTTWGEGTGKRWGASLGWGGGGCVYDER